MPGMDRVMHAALSVAAGVVGAVVDAVATIEGVLMLVAAEAVAVAE